MKKSRRELIRKRQRHNAKDTLRALITEGLASGPSQPVPKDFFVNQRKRLGR